MTNRLLQHGFGGGEIAPSMLGRIDLPHYKMGAFKIDNFLVLPQGAIRSRSGFKFVGTPNQPYRAVRLIPFRYSSTQTYALEFSHYTMRIISNGGYVLDENDNIYEVTTPYSAENLKYLDYSQNADIVTITSNLYPPYELRRYSNTDWRFVTVSLTPGITAPTGLSVNPVYANQMTSAESASKDKITVTYVVTAFDENEKESAASEQVSGRGNYYISGAKIRVSWSAVEGAVRYRVYRSTSGIFGYVGETENLYLEDQGLNPDTTVTPPRYKNVFTESSQQITSVTIDNGGSGYVFGIINSLTYLPRTLTIDAIEPYVSSAGASQSDVESWELTNPRIEIINGSTSLVEKTFPVPVEYAYFTDGSSNVYKIAYISEPFTFTVTNNKLGLPNPVIRFTCDNADSVAISYLGAEQQPTAKQSNTHFNNFHVGITIADFLSAFPQSTTCQLPLTISDQVGVNADIDVLCVDGVVTEVIVNSLGYSYSAYTTATLNSTVGSGAEFTVNTTGSGLPDYPSAVTQYDQRRVFAGSSPHPLKCWFTNAGQQDLMAYHIPVVDDDRIEIEAVTSDADRIKHLVALDSLLLFTSTSELRVYTQNSDALTPKSIAVRAQSYVGANEVQPVVANNTIIYSASRGGHIRALGYDYSQNGYITQDIALRCPHLFDNKEIVSISLAKSPVQVIWAVSTDGTLLSCTYLPEQQLVAWAQHHTVNGLFEDVCAISEGQEDHIYAVINRNGIRRIERMDNLRVNTSEPMEYRYLDSYLDAVFASETSVVNGLSHLEGHEVAVFVDGVQQTNKTVENGAITLDSPGLNVAVGLPITDTLITVPLASMIETNATLEGRTKNIAEAYFRVSYDGNIKANAYPNKDDSLYTCKKEDIYMKLQDDESYLVKVSVDGDWSEQGQIKVVHDDCLPLEIQALILNANYEDGK